MAKVFVSHSHADNEDCREFVRALHHLGVATWYDEDDLKAGVIGTSIEVGMPTCDAFVVILSPAAVTSTWVRREYNAAMDLEGRRKLQILPVIAQPCEVPPLLGGYMRIEGVHTPESAARLAHQMLFLDPAEPAAPKYELKVVTSPDDPDLDQFFAIYQHEFPLVAERATPEDMARYIVESHIEKAKPHPEYLEELVLVKRRGQVVAFMNYTFYYSSRFVFVSYIANTSGVRASSAVIGSILAHFKDQMTRVGCLAVVFEVESKRIKPTGEIARIRKFRQYLKAYAQLVHTNCYEIVFDYIQPYLLIDEVADDAGREHGLLAIFGRPGDAGQHLGLAHALALGLIPLTADFVQGQSISKANLMNLLRFVYGQVYGDSFIDDPDDDKRYKAYMQRLLRHYQRTLPKAVKLKSTGT